MTPRCLAAITGAVKLPKAAIAVCQDRRLAAFGSSYRKRISILWSAYRLIIAGEQVQSHRFPTVLSALSRGNTGAVGAAEGCDRGVSG